MQTIESIIAEIDRLRAVIPASRERVETALRAFLKAQDAFVASGETEADDGPAWRRQEDLGIALDEGRVRVLDMEDKLRDLERDLRMKRYAMDQGR